MHLFEALPSIELNLPDPRCQHGAQGQNDQRRKRQKR